MVQGRPSKAALNKKKTLALARQVRLEIRHTPTATMVSPIPNTDTENQDAGDESPGDDIECTGWSGGVTHYISSDEEVDSLSNDSDEEVEELTGSELEGMIQRNRGESAGVRVATEGLPAPSAKLEAPVQQRTEPAAVSVIMGQRTNREWKKAENARSLGYNGRSVRTKRRHEKAMRDKEAEDAKLRKG